jgi:hypothetical protein
MFKKKILIICALAFLVCLLLPSNVFAGSKTANLERGLQNVGYSRDSVYWSWYDHPQTILNNYITNSYAWQNCSGLFVSTNGISKAWTTSTGQHVYQGKKTFFAGAKIFGQSLGYTKTITDRATVGKTGGHYWDLDV